MSDQYYRDSYKPADNVERVEPDPNSPMVNADPFADKVPVDAAVVHEIPMGGTIAAVSPVNEPVPAEVPLFETPIQEIPMGGTVAAVGPMDEATLHEVPEGAAIVYDTPKMQTSPSIDPMDETLTHQAPVHQDTGSLAALLPRGESEHFRTRWNEIQGKFVDDPRVAVQQADALVSEVIDQITQVFANEHRSLEGKWNQGNNVTTEDLRLALQHYRTFFNRLVV